MKFNEKVRLLKEKVGEKVLFVQNGNFYIAIGKDAVLLNELFNLKCTCFIKYLCKVGIPIRSLNRYLVALKEKLKLIPKSERYIQYIIELIIKLPRTEKFSIGNEYKSSLYNMLENIMYLNKTIRIKNSNETTRNDKNNFMKKVIELKYNIRNEKMTYKEAKKYLCGHIGYIQIANVKGLINNLFYSE